MKGSFIMACFLVPATEAIVTTIVAKAVKSHEAKAEDQTKVKALSEDKLPLSKKITRLLRLSVGRLRSFSI